MSENRPGPYLVQPDPEAEWRALPRDKHGYPRRPYIADNDFCCAWGSDESVFANVSGLPWPEAVSIFGQWYREQRSELASRIKADERRRLIAERNRGRADKP
jgi:hypothetical protein